MTAEETDALFTDQYELTMLQAYFNEGMNEDAVFDLYVRRLPQNRNFLVACGLEQVLDFLEDLSFSPAAMAYLDSLALFSADFLHYLSRIQFTGNVRAMPEGTVAFAEEPLLEIEAPIQQAQLIETYLLNQVTFQTMIATKGARAVIASEGRTLVDFGSRRAHGTDAALKASRALYIAGYDSTSNVLAARRYGIPATGTMAHSYIQAHDAEDEAFRAFLRTYPETVLLVDTYDTPEGVRRAARVAHEVPGARLRAVRLDSGNLASLAKEARSILDEAGLRDVGIFASGGLDEYEIESLLASGAPITAFGVGAAAVVSSDAASLDSAYKLASYAGKPRLKLSTDKTSLPGKKQVFRSFSEEGRMKEDVIGLAEETINGESLLEEVMRDGKRTVAGRSTIDDARNRARQQLARLPDALRGLKRSEVPYRTALSESLDRERKGAQGRVAR